MDISRTLKVWVDIVVVGIIGFALYYMFTSTNLGFTSFFTMHDKQPETTTRPTIYIPDVTAEVNGGPNGHDTGLLPIMLHSNGENISAYNVLIYYDETKINITNIEIPVVFVPSPDLLPTTNYQLKTTPLIIDNPRTFTIHHSPLKQPCFSQVTFTQSGDF